VFAELNGIPFTEEPLKDDFSIDIDAYIGCNKTVFIANPNAPTGLALSLSEIEQIVASNPNNVVIVDEAYVDFGAESAVSLIHKYDNLLVTQTFSKSRSMAGARLGMGFGCAALIQDLNTVKYSTNPYNVNRMSMAAGIGALEDAVYFEENCKRIIETRAWTTVQLEALGFRVVPSSANFVFAAHPRISGETLYLELKKRGILVRHFNKPRLCEFNRITIGSDNEMQIFITTVRQILEELL
jgi:histidinol-phosphate aminotransferase